MSSNEGVVKSDVVSYKYTVPQHELDLFSYVGEGWGVRHHVVGNAGEGFNSRRNQFVGIDEGTPAVKLFLTICDNDADFCDSACFGGTSCCFYVDDGKLHRTKMGLRYAMNVRAG